MMTSTVILGLFGDDVDMIVDEMLNLLVIHAKVHHKTKERAFSLVPDLRTKDVILEFQTF